MSSLQNSAFRSDEGGIFMLSKNFDVEGQIMHKLAAFNTQILRVVDEIETEQVLHDHVAAKHGLEKVDVHFKPKRLRPFEDVQARWELEHLLRLLVKLETEIPAEGNSWLYTKPSFDGLEESLKLWMETLRSCGRDVFEELCDTVERFTDRLEGNVDYPVPPTQQNAGKVGFHATHVLLMHLHVGAVQNPNAGERQRDNLLQYADMMYHYPDVATSGVLELLGDGWWENVVFDLGLQQMLKHPSCPAHVTDLYHLSA